MPARTRLLAAEEFAGIPDDDQHYELVEGRVVRMSPPIRRFSSRAATESEGLLTCI
jgi:hypothetical protein